ncbi:MAG: ABC transporter permease [Planctomycetaceae bacterium]|jgi:ABC-type transport system involved in multi-copper enzyme maturation permease subunit|nr:ABC transporter permease [Planctomycetaceae bacterium]
MQLFLPETVLFSYYVPNWIQALQWVDLGALGVAILAFAVFLLLMVLFPKVGAIAWVTFKEAVMQPLFIILILFGLFALFFFLFIPYHTLGDDIKLVITQGLTLIKLIAVFLAIWTASNSIADELEGKTALMILAKPVGRRKFLIGKYFGVIMAVILMFFILGLFFLNSISYKVVFDARESAKDAPTVLECLHQMKITLPGLLLSFLETMVMAAIAVAISTRLSLLPNLTLCLTVLAVGYLAPVILEASIGQNPLVAFVARFASTIFPVLAHFNMETSIATGQFLPNLYLFWATCYALLYCTLATTVGLLLFEDRDLA